MGGKRFELSSTDLESVVLPLEIHPVDKKLVSLQSYIYLTYFMMSDVPDLNWHQRFYRPLFYL